MKNQTESYIANTLAAHIGCGNIPVSEVAREMGISESLVYQHKSQEGACPTSVQLLFYMRILPASFANAILQAADLVGAYHPASVKGCLFKTTLHAINRTSGLLGKLSEAAEDGRIDHRERISVPNHILAATTYLNSVVHSYREGAQ